MASPNLDVPEVAANQNNKTTTINDGVAQLDKALCDITTVDMAGADYTVPLATMQNCITFAVYNQGATLRTVTLPTIKRLFAFKNTDATNTVDVAKGTTSFNVPADSVVLLYMDGTTDGLFQVSSSGGGGASAFTGLSDTPSSYSGAGTKVAAVNSGETALEFLDISAVTNMHNPFMGARVRKTAAQAIAATTNTPVTFDVEDFDTNAFHDNATNNTRFTIPAGKGITKVVLTCNLDWGTPGSGYIQTYFSKNGEAFAGRGGQSGNATAGSELQSLSSGPITVTDGDYLELVTYSTVAGSIDAVLATNYSLVVLESSSIANAYDFGFTKTATPTVSEVIGKVLLGRATEIPADFAGAVGQVDVNPTASFAVDVKQNVTSIGTITISTGGVVTFVTSGGTAKSIAIGDVITFIAPASTDATVAGIAVTVLTALG